MLRMFGELPTVSNVSDICLVFLGFDVIPMFVSICKLPIICKLPCLETGEDGLLTNINQNPDKMPCSIS